jgi:hypothetical protein
MCVLIEAPASASFSLCLFFSTTRKTPNFGSRSRKFAAKLPNPGSILRGLMGRSSATVGTAKTDDSPAGVRTSLLQQLDYLRLAPTHSMGSYRFRGQVFGWNLGVLPAKRVVQACWLTQKVWAGTAQTQRKFHRRLLQVKCCH